MNTLISEVDAVDGTSTGTMDGALLKLPQIRGASHEDDNDKPCGLHVVVAFASAYWILA
jgi:hypothetical protein